MGKVCANLDKIFNSFCINFLTTCNIFSSLRLFPPNFLLKYDQEELYDYKDILNEELYVNGTRII